jgi:hypothetical protein
MIEISTVIRGYQAFDATDFSAHASYDQGSAKGNTHTYVDEIIGQFNTQPGYIRMGIAIMITVVLSAIFFVVIRESYRYLYLRNKRKLE